MPYTYSKIAPTPAWITVNPTTGRVSWTNAPSAGYTGIARFQITDGINTVTRDVPITIEPSYEVALSYQEVTYINWLSTVSATTEDIVGLPPLDPDTLVTLAGVTATTTDTDTTPTTNIDFATIVVDGDGNVVTSGGLVVSTDGNPAFDTIVVDGNGNVVTSGGLVVSTDGNPAFDAIVVDGNGNVVTSGGVVVVSP